MPSSDVTDRYQRAAHRVQTAIATLMAMPGYNATDPKHLRVGIDMSKSDMGGLATLLIEKGVITQDEYIEAVTAAAEREALSFERQIQALLGNRNIKLG